MDYSDTSGALGPLNWVTPQTVEVTHFNGTGTNYFLYYTEQAPTFITPPSDNIGGMGGDVGATVSGQTNAQNCPSGTGSCVAGKVAPCSTMIPNVVGYVCGN
jgi:hypothetical protein